MIFLILLMIVCSFAAEKWFLVLYESVRLSVVNSIKDTENKNKSKKHGFWVAIASILPSVILFHFSGSIWVFIAFFLFGCVAYTDFIVHWVPDCLIYAALSVSLLNPDIKLNNELWLSVFLFLLPVVILQAVSYVRKRFLCISSGDFYMFPAMAVWVLPEYAAPVMLTAIGVAILFSRKTNKVPFMTCLFFVFSGYQLCAFYS
ncbi:TPA: hypothetical protein I7721_19635 [Vibrio vulnificus]|nr:hypothetical protein [Vibrio vulnificus]